MNEHTLKVLEYPNLLEQIQSYAMSESGRQLIAKFKPQTTLKRAFQMTDLFKSLLDLRNSETELPEAEFFSPEVILVKLKPKGAILDLLEIHVLRRLLEISERVRKFVTRDGFNDNESFQKLSAGLYNYSETLEYFDTLFDDKGDVKD